MQIFVRQADGKLRVANIDIATTPVDLSPAPLVHNGRPLFSARSLVSQGIRSQSTLEQAVGSLCGGAPKKCSLPECVGKAIKIIGHCRYCEEQFCGKHRLPETHACRNLNSCREASHQRNESKLMDGKCVAGKL